MYTDVTRYYICKYTLVYFLYRYNSHNRQYDTFINMEICFIHWMYRNKYSTSDIFYTLADFVDFQNFEFKKIHECQTLYRHFTISYLEKVFTSVFRMFRKSFWHTFASTCPRIFPSPLKHRLAGKPRAREITSATETNRSPSSKTERRRKYADFHKLEERERKGRRDGEKEKEKKKEGRQGVTFGDRNFRWMAERFLRRCSKNPQYPVYSDRPTGLGVSILITSKRRDATRRGARVRPSPPPHVHAEVSSACVCSPLAAVVVDLHEIESLLAVRRDRRPAPR